MSAEINKTVYIQVEPPLPLDANTLIGRAIANIREFSNDRIEIDLDNGSTLIFRIEHNSLNETRVGIIIRMPKHAHDPQAQKG